MILDGKELEFYIWNKNGGLEKSLAELRKTLTKLPKNGPEKKKTFAWKKRQNPFNFPHS